MQRMPPKNTDKVAPLGLTLEGVPRGGVVRKMKLGICMWCITGVFVRWKATGERVDEKVKTHIAILKAKSAFKIRVRASGQGHCITLLKRLTKSIFIHKIPFNASLRFWEVKRRPIPIVSSGARGVAWCHAQQERCLGSVSRAWATSRTPSARVR